MNSTGDFLTLIAPTASADCVDTTHTSAICKTVNADADCTACVAATKAVHYVSTDAAGSRSTCTTETGSSADEKCVFYDTVTT